MKIKKQDLPFLMEDVADYLMERDSDIGTNFLEEFPHSYVSGRRIFLYDKRNRHLATLTISLPRKDKVHTYIDSLLRKI